MSEPIQNLRNLGVVMARMLAEVDVYDEDDLRSIGAIDAYHRLTFRFGTRVNLNASYAMEGALLDCDWRQLETTVKAELRSQLQGIGKKSI